MASSLPARPVTCARPRAGLRSTSPARETVASRRAGQILRDDVEREPRHRPPQHPCVLHADIGRKIGLAQRARQLRLGRGPAGKPVVGELQVGDREVRIEVGEVVGRASVGRQGHVPPVDPEAVERVTAGQARHGALDRDRSREQRIEPRNVEREVLRVAVEDRTHAVARRDRRRVRRESCAAPLRSRPASPANADRSGMPKSVRPCRTRRPMRPSKLACTVEVAMRACFEIEHEARFQSCPAR